LEISHKQSLWLISFRGYQPHFHAKSLCFEKEDFFIPLIIGFFAKKVHKIKKIFQTMHFLVDRDMEGV
jgi:hypothetical protein